MSFKLRSPGPPEQANWESPRTTKSNQIERFSLSSQAVSRLRAKILSGQIPAHTQFIVEDLAQELGISRTPVRDALSKLVSMGLVNYDGNSYIVAGYSAKDVRELYAIRIVLEDFAIREAARHLSDDQISGFRRLCERSAKSLKETGEDQRVMIKLDTELHQLVYRGSRNSRLKAILDDIQEKILLIHKWGYFTKKVEYLESSKIQEYTGFLACLESRDADGAAGLLKRHLDEGLQFTLVCLGFDDRAD